MCEGWLCSPVTKLAEDEFKSQAGDSCDISYTLQKLRHITFHYGIKTVAYYLILRHKNCGMLPYVTA